MNTQKRMASEIFDTIGQAIGIHVMLLVLEHAHWKTKQQHEEANLIHFAEEGISLDGLDALEPEKAKLIAGDFIMAIIATLGRLVGIQLANQLTEQLQHLEGGCNL